MAKQRSDGSILVTGATGNVGRHVVRELAQAGARVRALSRGPAAGLPAGVEPVRADLLAPHTVEAALDGVEVVFLVWPFADAAAAGPLVEAVARRARRIVYLSAAAVRDDGDPEPRGVWGGVERLIEGSGLAWTFLRPTGFATNTLMWAPQVRTGVVRWPYGAAARSLIHERDIAAVAARVLAGDGHGGARHVLSGPEVLTQVEQVAAIGEALGRPLRYEELSPEESRRQLLGAGWPAPFVEAALASWAAMVAQPEPVTTTVADVTGRPALSFREWAAEHAPDFR
jgi:uncharacterized protein YbjT (DUF2867 family)